MSRNEDILRSILREEAYDKLPQSRIEALLIDVAELISHGGATDDQVEQAVKDYLDTHPVLVTIAEPEEAKEYLDI